MLKYQLTISIDCSNDTLYVNLTFESVSRAPYKVIWSITDWNWLLRFPAHDNIDNNSGWIKKIPLPMLCNQQTCNSVTVLYFGSA